LKLILLVRRHPVIARDFEGSDETIVKRRRVLGRVLALGGNDRDNRAIAHACPFAFAAATLALNSAISRLPSAHDGNSSSS